MAQENKFYLPYVLDGIMTKLSALFIQKLVLFDSEVLQAKHMRHYDHECQGLMSLVHFIQRKINKNSVFAFQMIKDPNSNFFDNEEIMQEDQLKDVTPKTSLKNLQETTTPRTKFLSRVNTTFQESDNSFIFSPNMKKHGKTTSRTQFMDSNVGQKNQILQKLLNRVRKVNSQASQQFINPTKSSYFNLTLGKQSLQTFQNHCNCECHNQSCNKETKMMKRKRILQKFQRIEQKIYQQAPVYVSTYVTPKPINRVYKHRGPKTTYSVYDQTIYDQRPREIIYVKSRSKRDPYYDVRSTGMSTSKSVAHIEYAHQVYI